MRSVSSCPQVETDFQPVMARLYLQSGVSPRPAESPVAPLPGPAPQSRPALVGPHLDGIRDYVVSHYKRVVGWGTGQYLQDVAPQLDVKLDYLVDSDERKWGTTVLGCPVVGPDALRDEDPSETLVIVFSMFYFEIRERVYELGGRYCISARALVALGTSVPLPADSFSELSRVVVSVSKNNLLRPLSGTAKFIRHQQAILRKNGHDNVHIFWRRYTLKGLEHAAWLTVFVNGEKAGIIDLDAFLETLRAHASRIEGVVVHNLIGLDREVLSQITNTIPGVRVLYYAHDFSSVCAQIQLRHDDGTFCAAYEDAWRKCDSCRFGTRRLPTYEFHSSLFARSNVTIVAPSPSTADVLTAAFRLPPDRVAVLPHLTYERRVRIPEVNERIRVAYVGYKAVHKGWDTFKSLAAAFGDRYEWFCLGRSDEPLDGVTHVDVSFIDDGPDAMTKALRQHRIDIAVLWSIWPETYSYTYFESAAAGAFVVTTRESGNIQDEVRRNGNGIVLTDADEFAALLADDDRLREVLRRPRGVLTDISDSDGFLKLIEPATANHWAAGRDSA